MGKRLGALLLLCLAPLAGGADWPYRVRPGDSLWSLCQRFAEHPGTCRRRLAGHNHLSDPDRVLPGDVLAIPRDWIKDAPFPARLTMQRGDVMRYPSEGGPAQPLESGQPIAYGEAIETGEGAARIRFPDQAEVLVRPRSLLVLRRYPRHPGRAGVTELRLQRGAIRVHRFMPQLKNSRFRVYTPGGTVTVRGIRYELSVDHRETTRGEALAGRMIIDAGGQRTGLAAGQGILVSPGDRARVPRPLLPAPALHVHGGRHQLAAVWSPQAGARAYWLELYALPDRTLLAETRLTGHDWRRRLPPGDYRLEVRAVDADGLRGRVARARVRVGAPPPAETVTPQPAPAPRQQRSHKKRDLWIFLGAAALMTII